MVLLVIGLVSRALRVFDTTFCFPVALRFVLLWPFIVVGFDVLFFFRIRLMHTLPPIVVLIQLIHDMKSLR
jgi:hypothetical protein